MSRRGTILWLAALLAAAVGARPTSVGAGAQDDKKREGQLRTVHGTVIDKEENGLGGAVVYLKNQKTQTVKTHIAENDGRYRFSGLDPNVDYEIHASHREMASGKKTISSFDSRKEIVIHLKVDKKK